MSDPFLVDMHNRAGNHPIASILGHALAAGESSWGKVRATGKPGDESPITYPFSIHNEAGPITGVLSLRPLNDRPDYPVDHYRAHVELTGNGHTRHVSTNIPSELAADTINNLHKLKFPGKYAEAIKTK